MSEYRHNERTHGRRTATERGRTRWPGAVFSLLVPGFGLLRAGHPVRALAWFLGLQAAACAVALLIVARAAPTSVACAGVAALVVAMLALLKDSFRPGRMTWRLWVVFGAALLGYVAVPRVGSLIAPAYTVPNAAMEPTLRGAKGGTADHIFVGRVGYLFSTPRRGDLVAFRTTGIPGIKGDTMFVKRLVGLPGERIEIRDGRLFANERLLDERDGIPAIRYSAAQNGVYRVADDGFFVLGDNSAQSFDSRYWGSVPRGNLHGRVARIYYPWSRIGTPR